MGLMSQKIYFSFPAKFLNNYLDILFLLECIGFLIEMISVASICFAITN